MRRKTAAVLIDIGLAHAVSPLEQVTHSDDGVLASEQTALGPVNLKILHGLDHEGRSGLRQLALLDEDLLQLIGWNVLHLDEHETILEGFRQLLPAAVALCRVLRGEQAEVLMRLNGLLGLNNVQLAVVIEQAIESLEHFGRSQVELVKNDPVTVAHGLN